MGCNSAKTIIQARNALSENFKETIDKTYYTSLPQKIISISSNSKNIPYVSGLANIDDILSDETIDAYSDESFPLTLGNYPLKKGNPLWATKCTPEIFVVNEENSNLIKWVRIPELLPNDDYSIFTYKLYADELKLNHLGSSYLYSALAALSIDETNIRKLFITQMINNKGVYAMRMLIQGEYHIVTIDDYFPVKEKDDMVSIIFTSHVCNSIWGMILEKCWAKVNQSCYIRTMLGTPNEILTSLSEAPCYQYNHEYILFKDSKDILWEKITRAIDLRLPICCSTEKVSDEKKTDLIAYHSYSIINYYNLENIRLIKIKNPEGAKTWKGRYSSGSSQLTDEVKQKIIQRDKESNKPLKDLPGTFLMSLGDYLKEFLWTYVSNIISGYEYRSCHFIMKGKYYPIENVKSLFSNESYGFARLIIKQNTKGTICLHLPLKRFMSIHYPDYVDPLSTIILAKLIVNPFDKNDYCYLHIKSQYVNDAKIYLNVDLNPGEYHLLFKSEWQYPENYDLVISTYASLPIDIYELPTDSLRPNVIEEILQSLAYLTRHREGISEDEPHSFYTLSCLESNRTGFGILFYDNKSIRSGFLKVEVSFQDPTGYRLLYNKEYVENNKFNFYIPPGTSDYIIIKIDKPSNHVKIDMQQNILFDYPYKEIVTKALGTEAEKVIHENNPKGIKVRKLSHDKGFMIYITNDTKNDYDGSIRIDNIAMKEYTIQRSHHSFKDSRLSFVINQKGEYCINCEWKTIVTEFDSSIDDISFNLI